MGMNGHPPKDKPLYRPSPPPPSNRSWEDVERSRAFATQQSEKKKMEEDDGVSTFVGGAIIGALLMC